MEQNQESQKQEQEKPKEGPTKPGFLSKQKEKMVNYRRVISVARKPDKEEFSEAVKITGSGILFIGFIGFAIFLLYYFISGGMAL